MDTSHYDVIPLLITNNRIYSKIRSSENWELIVNKKYTDQDWIENFRMTGFVWNLVLQLVLKCLHRKKMI